MTSDTPSGSGYRHLLVAYDGSPEGDEAVLAADLLAQAHGARLTIAVVVQLERPSRRVGRVPQGTGVWNDVMLDEARADLFRASRLAHSPAELTVLFGPVRRAVPEGATELGCDVLMLPPRPRSRLRRFLSHDRARGIRRRTPCEVLQPR